jgi:hypothetical protein
VPVLFRIVKGWELRFLSRHVADGRHG